MATSTLYHFEDCFKDSLRAKFLNKLEFDDLPLEVLQSILYSDDETNGNDDDFAALQEEELVSLMGTKNCDQDGSLWWNREKVDQLSVDQFMGFFVRSRLFRQTVKKLMNPLFCPSKMETLQLADNGEDLLASIEDCDDAEHCDILKLRKVELVKSDRDAPGCSSISAKYTASFEFSTTDLKAQRHVSTWYNTGSLFLLFASLGELGNTGEINNSTNNDIRLEDSSYEIGVNSGLSTWGSKLRFLKNTLLSVMIDAKYLWKCMMEEPEHPFFKECHPPRNGGNLQTSVFIKKYAYRFAMRHGTETTEKQMFPKIRYSKNSGKHYMKFSMSVLRKMGKKEKRKTFDDSTYITDYELRSTLHEGLHNASHKVYRYFHVFLHSLLGRKKLCHSRREKLGYGDLIRFCVSTTCYCDSQKNIFTVLHSPRGSAEVVLAKMYLRHADGAEMSKATINPRLQQIALRNMMEGESDDDDKDLNDLFKTSESLQFTTQRKELTDSDAHCKKQNEREDDDDDMTSFKRVRRSITDVPFQYQSF